MSDLRTELLQIREKRGILIPTVVIEEASDPNHPLHGRFSWEDDEETRRWRLVRARNMLRFTFRIDLGGTPVSLGARR